jgi:chemotaxis response regulator CheB
MIRAPGAGLHPNGVKTDPAGGGLIATRLRGNVNAISASDVSVLVVDDQERFRGVLRDLIALARGFALVGEACSGEEATEAVAALLPQLVLMDVVMPGMGGIAAARLILQRRPAPVVVLISVDDPAQHPEADSLGAAVPFLRKQELRPLRLRELWETHRKTELSRARR